MGKVTWSPEDLVQPSIFVPGVQVTGCTKVDVSPDDWLLLVSWTEDGPPCRRTGWVALHSDGVEIVIHPEQAPTWKVRKG